MKTPLHDIHLHLKAQMVEFAGWQMPMRYGSTIDEHHAVRNHAGMFDVSHMLPVDVTGTESTQFLQHLLATDVLTLTADGHALYSVMLNEKGGIIDDLIVYRLSNEQYRIILNAGAATADLEWIDHLLRGTLFEVNIDPRRDLNILAVQGPAAVKIAEQVLNIDLQTVRRFSAIKINGLFIARTGYTGEDGVEILCVDEKLLELWEQFHRNGVIPCGLGARDTLRLEAGMNLYGQDMDNTTTPFESGIAWVLKDLAAERDFVGKNALLSQQRNGIPTKLTGIVLEGAVMRSGYEVSTSVGKGIVTSGTFSPTLRYSIALARIPRTAKGECEITIRSKSKIGRIVRPPFVREGERVHQ